jgi:hypothetical protein
LCGVRKNAKTSDDVGQKLFFHMVGRVLSITMLIDDENPLMIHSGFSFCMVLAAAVWSLVELG